MTRKLHFLFFRYLTLNDTDFIIKNIDDAKMTFADSFILEGDDAKMTNNTLPKYMNLQQTCQYLNVKSINTLYKLIDDGLPVIKIGRSRRVSQEAADRYMESKTVNKQF